MKLRPRHQTLRSALVTAWQVHGRRMLPERVHPQSMLRLQSALSALLREQSRQGLFREAQ